MKNLRRKCRSCKLLSIDNYGRCRTPRCVLELRPQHPNVTYEWRRKSAYWRSMPGYGF